MRVVILLFLLAAGCQFHQVKDAASLSGSVTSANGPEAGVWVIAETTGLATRFRRGSGAVMMGSRAMAS